MKTPSRKLHIQPEIQSLRGIAVLLVVIFHAWPALLAGGYVGVDVFFIVSGFLITRHLVNELDHAGQIDFAQFYARRVRRLVPALLVVVSASLAVVYVYYSPLEAKMLTSSAIAAAAYLSNFWFAHLSTDYLAEDSHANPFLHTWSLGVEEQFYLLWPVLLLLAFRASGHKPAQQRLAWAIAAVSGLSLVACILLTERIQPWAFFGSPTRAWEFGAGGLTALLSRTEWGKACPFSRYAGLLGLLAIAVAAITFSGHTKFPGIPALLPVVGSCLVLWSCRCQQIEWVSRLLRTRSFQWLGDLSYSLYLWHWPVLVFARDSAGGSSSLVTVVGVASSVLLAWVTYRWVENPIRYSAPLFRRPLGSLAGGMIATLLVITVAGGVRYRAAVTMDDAVQRRYTDAPNDLPRIYDDKCHAGYWDTALKDCIYGDPSSSHTVVLFGDSHAAQWFPALEKLALERHWRLVSFTKSACPSVTFEPIDRDLGRQYVECTHWRENVFERVATLKPTVVVLANSSKYFPDGSDLEETAWRAAVEATLSRLQSSADYILGIRDTPWPGISAPQCLARAAWRKADVRKSCVFTSEEAPSRLGAVEIDVFQGRENAALIDMNQVVCPSSPCALERAGAILYSDSHHLTASFSRQIADSVYARFPIRLKEFLRD